MMTKGAQLRDAGEHDWTAVLQATHAVPPVLHVWLVSSVRQVLPSQHPVGQVVALQGSLEPHPTRSATATSHA